MASGKTHDWVTLAFLPSIWLIGRWQLHLSLHEAILVTVGTFIGGFFLSPDLDIRSRPFYRWGPLRFIWWPYQWAIRHRSSWSHGIVWASWLRLIYLTAVLSLLYIGGSLWLRQAGMATQAQPGVTVRQWLHLYWQDWWWLGLGLWAGALIHIGLDWLTSAFPFKRRRR